jgi:3-oxocholest-4-en-26-oate---CoA ligase
MVPNHAGSLAIPAGSSNNPDDTPAHRARYLTDHLRCPAMELHYATIWESIADTIPAATAIVHGDTVRTWAEYDERAARLAAAYIAGGLGPDSKVALYMYNGNEYLEAQYAAFKMRGVPVNVNYRYLDDELWYLLDNADAEALVFHSSLGDRVAKVLTRLPKLKLLIEVDDGGLFAGAVGSAEPYDDVIAVHAAAPRVTRSEDDIYMLYTGGTTGMPKGVMYDMASHVGLFLRSGWPFIGQKVPETAAAVAPQVAAITEAGARMIAIPCAPLMHGTGLWLGAFAAHLTGGEVITLTSRTLDPHEVLRTAQARRATSLVIVGDAFAKPLIAAIDDAVERDVPYDLSSIGVILSSGVMWTTEVKQQLLERIPQTVLFDAIGSTEGSMGNQMSTRGGSTDTATFTQNPTTKVFTADGREVVPGSDEVGMVAAGGFVPLGYFKDPEKSARTFRTVDGVRYSFPGDLAQVGGDGRLILLGRGSQVINSGGEKIFPEEVEEAVKRVPGVRDCLVVGVADDRFGQAVTAVAACDDPDVDEAAVIAHVKSQLASYKAPKRVIFVAEVPRAANGKADYPTAKQYAVDALGIT